MVADLRKGKRAGRFVYAKEGAAADLVQGAVLAGMRTLLDGQAPPSHAQAVTVHILRGLGIGEREARELARAKLPDALRLPAALNSVRSRRHPKVRPDNGLRLK